MIFGTDVPFAVRDTVGMLPNSDLPATRTMRSTTGAMISVGYPMPFGRTASAVSFADAFVFGDAARFELRFYSAQGVLSRIVRIAEALRPVSATDMAAYATAYTSRLRPEARASSLEVIKASPAPKSWPAFGRILGDDGGRIWVQSFAVDELAAQSWLIFDRSGALLGQIGTPAGVQVLDVGTTYVLGLRKDADDVESVVSYTLTAVR